MPDVVDSRFQPLGLGCRGEFRVQQKQGSRVFMWKFAFMFVRNAIALAGTILIFLVAFELPKGQSLSLLCSAFLYGITVGLVTTIVETYRKRRK